MRDPVLPVLTGPLPPQPESFGEPEPTEELDLKTAWLQQVDEARSSAHIDGSEDSDDSDDSDDSAVDTPDDTDPTDTSIGQHSVRSLQVPSAGPPVIWRGAAASSRSPTSWVWGSVLGMGVATAVVLGIAWLVG